MKFLCFFTKENQRKTLSLFKSQTIKPLLPDKSKPNEKITLVEENKLINEGKGVTASILFFFLFQMLLKILKYQNLVTLILKQKIFPLVFSKRYLNIKTIQASLPLKK